MLRYFGYSFLLAAALLPSQALSADAPIPFDGTITDTCSIVVTQAGILDPRSNLTRLTSRSGPGAPGRANVTTNSNTFSLSVDAPTSFDTEPAGDVSSPETFRAWHRSNGATFYRATRTPEAINAGLNRVRIHMDARKTSGGIFASGNYSATVILRCE